MIKINLCPVDELESPYWLVPDAIAMAIVAAIAFFSMQYYLGTLQEQIDTVAQEAASLEENTAKLQPDLEKFKNLGKDIADLNTKLHALQSITVSKISKYKPVIVLEHLQNLRPEGLWFESVRIGFPEASANPRGGGVVPGLASGNGNGAAPAVDEGDTFEIKGQAFDNILTAEFMTAIRSTESQELDSGDLRTQVYFVDMSLIDAAIAKGGGGKGFPEMALFPEFSLRGRFKERLAPATPLDGRPKVAQPPDGLKPPPPVPPIDAPPAPPPPSEDVSTRLKAPRKTRKL